MAESLFERLARFRVAWVVATLGTLGVAGLVEVVAVFGAGVPDWYMHLAMWGLLATYALLATRALAARRRISGLAHFLVFAVLGLFWITVLVETIPEAPLVIQEERVTREALPILWLSVVLLGISLIDMLILSVVLPRRLPGPEANVPKTEEPKKTEENDDEDSVEGEESNKSA